MKRKTKIKPLGTPRESRGKRKQRTERQRMSFDVSGGGQRPPQYGRQLQTELKYLREVEGVITRSITGRLS